MKDGSKIATDGFANEYFVIENFNNWQTSNLAKNWLIEMGYNLDEIESVKADKITGSYKADLQLNVLIKLKNLSDIQNVSVKLVSNPNGFNQIDKRWVDKYVELWEIPENISNLLKYYTGELAPYKTNVRDSRRMFIDEFTEREQQQLVNFIENNKVLIISDILKGRGKFSAEWILVIANVNGEINSIIKPINNVLNFYAKNKVEFTKQGNIKIGGIGIQRKGGDGGKPTANMLQFKFNPMDLFMI